jgi:hypothetical protein
VEPEVDPLTLPLVSLWPVLVESRPRSRGEVVVSPVLDRAFELLRPWRFRCVCVFAWSASVFLLGSVSRSELVPLGVLLRSAELPLRPRSLSVVELLDVDPELLSVVVELLDPSAPLVALELLLGLAVSLVLLVPLVLWARAAGAATARARAAIAKTFIDASSGCSCGPRRVATRHAADNERGHGEVRGRPDAPPTGGRQHGPARNRIRRRSARGRSAQGTSPSFRCTNGRQPAARDQAEKLDPQPQVCFALGFLKEKPLCPNCPST